MTGRPRDRWFVALPPHGAARAVGEEAIRALSDRAGAGAVKVFDCRAYLKAFSGLLKNPEDTMVVDLLNQSLIVQCLDFQASRLLVLSLCPVTVFTLNLLRGRGVATVHWFYEDFRKALYWKEVLPGYDFFFAIQRGPIPGACAEKGARFGFLPTAACSVASIERPGGPPIAADLAFVGVPSPYRTGVLEFLASRGIRLALAGAGWNRYRGSLERFIVSGDWISAGQAAAILAGASIGLNLSMDDPETDRESVHISPRVFDILQAGCTLVTEDVPLVHETLRDCVFHTFRNAQQALAVIEDALSNGERERMAVEKNREIIGARHTYENRIGEMTALVAQAGEGAFPTVPVSTAAGSRRRGLPCS